MNSPMFAPSGTRLIEDLPSDAWARVQFQARYPGRDPDAPVRSQPGTFAGWDAEGNWTVLLKDGRTIGGTRADLTMHGYNRHQGVCPYAQAPLRGGLRPGTPVSVYCMEGDSWHATVKQGETGLIGRLWRHLAWRLREIIAKQSARHTWRRGG